jgi:hypothetical protein
MTGLRYTPNFQECKGRVLKLKSQVNLEKYF